MPAAVEFDDEFPKVIRIYHAEEATDDETIFDDVSRMLHTAQVARIQRQCRKRKIHIAQIFPNLHFLDYQYAVGFFRVYKELAELITVVQLCGQCDPEMGPERGVVHQLLLSELAGLVKFLQTFDIYQCLLITDPVPGRHQYDTPIAPNINRVVITDATTRGAHVIPSLISNLMPYTSTVQLGLSRTETYDDLAVDALRGYPVRADDVGFKDLQPGHTRFLNAQLRESGRYVLKFALQLGAAMGQPALRRSSTPISLENLTAVTDVEIRMQVGTCLLLEQMRCFWETSVDAVYSLPRHTTRHIRIVLECTKASPIWTDWFIAQLSPYELFGATWNITHLEDVTIVIESNSNVEGHAPSWERIARLKWWWSESALFTLRTLGGFRTIEEDAASKVSE